MFIDQLYHSKSFSCLVSNVTRTSHAYDMSKIWDSSCCPAETIRFMQTGRQADSLDLCPSLDVSAEQTSCLTTAFYKIPASFSILTVIFWT